MDSGAGSYRRFLAGDEDGLAEIIRDNKDGLILYLNGFVNDISVAEALAEDTFVKLAVKKPRDKGGASFRTWLYAIGRNLAVDWLRRRGRERERSVPLEEQMRSVEALEADYIREERGREVRRAMSALSPDYRQVLWLVYFEQFSCREAARVMRRSTHSVETLAYRARRALKEQLEKEGFSYDDIP